MKILQHVHVSTTGGRWLSAGYVMNLFVPMYCSQSCFGMLPQHLKYHTYLFFPWSLDYIKFPKVLITRLPHDILQHGLVM